MKKLSKTDDLIKVIFAVNDLIDIIETLQQDNKKQNYMNQEKDVYNSRLINKLNIDIQNIRKNLSDIVNRICKK
jgi:hypothetical protein